MNEEIGPNMFDGLKREDPRSKAVYASILNPVSTRINMENSKSDIGSRNSRNKSTREIKQDGGGWNDRFWVKDEKEE